MSICVRGLKEFKKSGCSETCPLHINVKNSMTDGTIEEFSGCADIWQATQLFKLNVRLDGIQQAIESLRNNISTKDGPKPDPALVKLLNLSLDTQRARKIANANS